jgi:hypothetical protein
MAAMVRPGRCRRQADEALALLTAKVGQHRVRAEPGAARDIVERSGRLPLALAVIAARATAADL